MEAAEDVRIAASRLVRGTEPDCTRIRAHTTLSSRQMEFLNLLKNFIIEREKVEKKDLINAPFTVIQPQGIRDVFSPAEINEILQLTERLAA